ncbi:MAG: hypothetical protein H8E91_04465 [Planctomycetes bacterium]|nr:hypothetical protein [Planctomycetota bacterium]
MWPTTVGAVCVIVGGLSLFGGCLSLSGMAEMEQLHTAIPFGDGELSEEIRTQIQANAPLPGVVNLIAGLKIFFAIALTVFGMALLQEHPKARIRLCVWSVLYIVLTIASIIIIWTPHWDLIQENSEVKGMFLAQLLISMPMYLILPVFLLVFLNKKQIQSEIATWR